MVPMALAKKAGRATLSTKLAPSSISSITPRSVGGLDHGDEPATGPGHDQRFGAGVEDLLHVGREVGRVRRGEDVIGHELAAEQRAGIAESCAPP